MFGRTGTSWTERAYLKASDSSVQSMFGPAVAIDASGTRIAVGAPGATRVVNVAGPPPSKATLNYAGATYVFNRAASTWTQQATLTAANPDANDFFGSAVALSGDGTSLSIASFDEGTAANGFLGSGDDNSAPNAGAVYLYRESGGTWAPGVVLKTLNARSGGGWTTQFTPAVATSSDGRSIAVGVDGGDSGATGFGGSPAGTAAGDSGAVMIW